MVRVSTDSMAGVARRVGSGRRAKAHRRRYRLVGKLGRGSLPGRGGRPLVGWAIDYNVLSSMALLLYDNNSGG